MATTQKCQEVLYYSVVINSVVVEEYAIVLERLNCP